MVIIAGQRPGDGAYRWGTRLRMFCLFTYGGGNTSFFRKIPANTSMRWKRPEKAKKFNGY